jgi:hypothetical protein
MIVLCYLAYWLSTRETFSGRVQSGVHLLSYLRHAQLAGDAPVASVLQSQDTFDSLLQIEFELQLNSDRGHGRSRFLRLEVENYLRGGTLGYIDPVMGLEKSMCTLMGVVMATVRSVQPHQRLVTQLVYLPILEIEVSQEGEGLWLCTQVEGTSLEDFQRFYQRFPSLNFYVWQFVCSRFIQMER